MLLAAPIRWVGDGIDTVTGYFFAVSENRRLKAELREMRRWREVAFALRDTNEPEGDGKACRAVRGETVYLLWGDA